MSYTSQLIYETIRSVDSSTLLGSYVTVGTPLANQSSILKMVNNSSVLVTVSVDGVNDCDVLPANSFFLYDATSDAPGNVPGVFFRQGTQFYIKGSAGIGSIYLVTLYVSQVG